MATPFTYTDLCKQVELQAMAEDIATLGKLAPKFSWQMPCKYVALDVNTPTDTRAGDHPVIHFTIDFRSQIKAAWPGLLDQLQQSGIPIPDIARTPILPGINDQCRNRVRPDGLEVNCWVYQFTGNENWQSDSVNGKQVYSIADSVPGMKYEGQNSAATALTLGYSPISWVAVWNSSFVDKTMFIYYPKSQKKLSFRDDSYASLNAFKTAMQGQYLVYQLATPIFIPFEQPVNLSLGELSKYTFIGAHDINDAPMYDLQTHFPYGDAPENPDGHHHFLLTRWNADWLRQHNEFPMTAITTFDGIGFVANYDSAFTDHFLLQDLLGWAKEQGFTPKGIIQ